MPIEAGAVGGAAGHEDVPGATRRPGGRRAGDLLPCSSSFPVVDVVEHYVEALAENLCQRLGVVAVAADFPRFVPERISRPAMQDGDVVTSIEQAAHQGSANEESSADHQDALHL